MLKMNFFNTKKLLNEALLIVSCKEEYWSEDALIPLGLTLASHCDILIAYMHRISCSILFLKDYSTIDFFPKPL